jgi:hypothetical protein
MLLQPLSCREMSQKPLDQELDSILDSTDAWFIHGNHDTDRAEEHDRLFGSALAERSATPGCDGSNGGVSVRLILFLDFDGVLHPDPPSSQHPLWCCASLLADWLNRHPDVGVVVSSTWRKDRSVEELKTLLPHAVGERVIGSTPTELVELYTRQVECEAWMRIHQPPWVPWLALDDRAWNFRPFAPRLVLTDRQTGLVSADVVRLEACFRKFCS